MKRSKVNLKFFFLLFCLLSFKLAHVNAQWSTTGAYTFTNPLTNKVGIGINTPSEMLTVYNSTNPAITVTSNVANYSLNLGISTCQGCYSNIARNGDAILRAVNAGKNLIITNNGGGSASNGSILFGTANAGNERIRMQINPQGQVLIGFGANDGSASCSSLPSGSLLGVNGTIYATLAKVSTLSSGCFPDYVFEKDYKLMSLEEVEKYIHKNKHLPEIPAAEELEKSGVDLVKMDANLLKKVEELTLHLIELKKSNDLLKSKVELLESRK